MKRLYFKSLATLLGAATLFSASTSAQAQLQPQTELYVVMFRADWCAPCKIVEPSIAQALSILRDPTIESLTIDITTPTHSEISAHKAFDRNIVQQYNSWLGVDMATHIRNLKTYAVVDQVAADFTCPEPNN